MKVDFDLNIPNLMQGILVGNKLRLDKIDIMGKNAKALLLINDDAASYSLVFTKKDGKDGDALTVGSTYASPIFGIRKIKEIYSGVETTNYSQNARPPWVGTSYTITSVAVEDPIEPMSTSSWFYNFGSCSSFHGMGLLDLSNTRDTSYMFSYCNNEDLKTLDVANWDTRNVTDMKSMFYECTTLTSLNAANWDTRNVTDMSYMFYKCTALSSLNVTNWDTRNVTNMNHMFYGTALSSLDVANWDTRNVTTMTHMFYECTTLSSLDVANWDTGNVTTMYAMFYECKKLISLDVSNWDTGNVTTMSYMFIGCTTLTYLNVTNWDTKKLANVSYTFCSCPVLNADCSSWDVSIVVLNTQLDAVKMVFNLNSPGVIPPNW